LLSLEVQLYCSQNLQKIVKKDLATGKGKTMNHPHSYDHPSFSTGSTKKKEVKKEALIRKPEKKLMRRLIGRYS
jgi:hypothetical protein